CRSLYKLFLGHRRQSSRGFDNSQVSRRSFFRILNAQLQIETSRVSEVESPEPGILCCWGWFRIRIQWDSALQTLDYFLPCAILSASGKLRSRSIAITPNNGPGASIANA